MAQRGMKKEAAFTLKCVSGHVEKRLAKDCAGLKDPPMCKTCFMPMFLVKVQT